MKFQDCIEQTQSINDLKRVAKIHVVDSKRIKDKDELIKEIVRARNQYVDKENIINTIQSLMMHTNRNVRSLYSIFLKTILLDKINFMEHSTVVNDEIRIFEQNIINLSNEFNLTDKHPQYFSMDIFSFVLKNAWDHDDNISIDEKNLILALQKKLGVSDKEYMMLEAKLKKFPKDNNELHNLDDIDDVRKTLMGAGLIFNLKDQNKDSIDIIPDEIATVLRGIWNIECRNDGYREILFNKRIKKKQYLETIILKSGIPYIGKSTINELQEFVFNNISPSNLIGGFSPRDGIAKDELVSWVKELDLQASGTKDELISRIIEYYDNYKSVIEPEGDTRKLYFEFFEELASRNIELLREKGVIQRDNEIEKYFEKATDYAFEVLLNHIPQKLTGSEHPDGIIAFKDKIIMWDNKSKNQPLNLREVMSQFSRYIQSSEKEVSAFICLAPSFESESDSVAVEYALTNDTVITLITATQFKEMCLKWSTSREKNPFPLGYFKQTGYFKHNIIKY